MNLILDRDYLKSLCACDGEITLGTVLTAFFAKFALDDAIRTVPEVLW